ncbi:MAG: hypothetical protein F4Y07_00655 [Gemmatimonadetes bacterium]|nr:hypothetical protein [Gemmatimonadota bacterium]MYB06288.1 hypothetical protein [Gemmatimonadota bacterium]MYE14968.1 hypothetical protein [Gemmatimonadota bacterium]MYG21222.1 hypothetical protein [Gemmatimonadota bacterium]MYJ40164.1 hypothetical protein [Gemmatimonadota bacterium]
MPRSAVFRRSEGIEEGRLTLLRQQINRKFGADTVRELFDAPDLPLDRERVDTLADAVVDCDTAEELLARVGDGVTAEEA